MPQTEGSTATHLGLANRFSPESWPLSTSSLRENGSDSAPLLSVLLLRRVPKTCFDLQRLRPGKPLLLQDLLPPCSPENAPKRIPPLPEKSPRSPQPCPASASLPFQKEKSDSSGFRRPAPIGKTGSGRVAFALFPFRKRCLVGKDSRR